MEPHIKLINDYQTSLLQGYLVLAEDTFDG